MSPNGVNSDALHQSAMDALDGGDGGGGKKGKGAASSKANSANGFSKANWALATGGSALENTEGSFRLGTTKLGFSPKYYGNGWGGNPYTETFNIAKVGRGLGYGAFGLGIAMDGVGVYNYYYNSDSSNVVSPAKAGLNTGMGAWGLLGGPYGVLVSSIYSLIEAFHPGGVEGMMDSAAKMQSELDNGVNKAGPNRVYIIPRGPK